MALPTISAGDLLNKGTTGMPANPELSVADLQAKFDELSLDVIVPKFQALVTALENASAGVDLGVTAPTGITASNKVKSVLDAMAVILLALKDKSDGDYDDLVSLFTGITAVSNAVDGLTTTIPTAKAITNYIQSIGGGDMLRTVYDTDNDGIVDNSERLGNQLPAYYASQQDLLDACAQLVPIQEDIAEIQTAIIDLTPIVLWTNANPTNSFAAQTVTLSETISKFTKYEILYASSQSTPQAIMSTGKIPIENRTILSIATDSAQYRTLNSAPSGTSVVFGNTLSFAYATGAQTTLNTALIPIQIIGYK